MITISRREFLRVAAALGAAGAWADSIGSRTNIIGSERRDLFPEGVASGDPDAHSVLLWTRRPIRNQATAYLRVIVSESETFTHIVAKATVSVSVSSDWTCRVLVGNLKPAHVYWYRFIDRFGNASRVGRTMTAPLDNDSRPVKFAFVCCHDATLGAQNALRRMIFEDERTPEPERLGFVLHLGDFYYEGVRYPEDRPQGVYGRPLNDVLRYPHGEKIGDFHFPTTVEDYRAAYHTYLHDPDLQDARARWPFVCIWDNGEFSWEGWQSIQILTASSGPRPAQTRKVAANQAWFEYQPARIKKSGGVGWDKFDPPAVIDAAINKFDDHGLGQEPNNLAALGSLTGYRALRWGKHVELLITDQRSYCSEPHLSRPEAQALKDADFPRMMPQEALEILDAGRAYAGGKPPQTIHLGDTEIPNFRKDDPPQTILGAEQKEWFFRRLKDSQATWKIWSNSIGTLDGREDPQNLPAGLTKPWPGAGFACSQVGDFASAYMERAEIYATVREAKITGFVAVSGNSHAFYAGLAAASLPPRAFEPVGVAFVTSSISSIGLFEYLEHTLPQTHPLRALYVGERAGASTLEPTANLLIRHGVRSCLAYQQTGDLERARSVSNPDLSPHLSFVDLAGHGYATVRVSGTALECEFVCIPRPLERSIEPDGGPLLYRVVHRTPLWQSDESPRLEQRVVEGNPALSL